MALTTGDQLEIDVHDDAAAMTRLFSLPVSARMDALAAMRGFSAFDDAPMKILKEIHENGDGFRVSVDDPRYPGALQQLIKADAWGQLRRELARAWEYQRSVLPGIHHPDKVEVVLTLGNPDDPIFTERTLGYYGMGARAEVFRVEVCGPDSTGAWYAGVTGPALDEAFAKVTSAFGTGSSFPDWTPYVLGDEVAGRLGHRLVGVPHMGGYAVGRQIVESYLAATGLRAAQAIVRPTAEILHGAGISAG